MARSETATLPVQVEATVVFGSIDTKAFWLDVLDRTGKTFLQNVLLFFAAGVTVMSVSWPAVLGSAGLAALVSFVLAVAGSKAISSGNFLVDLADRAVRTGAGAFAGALPLTGSILGIDWGTSLSIAGTAVLVSVCTSLVSARFGSAKGLPSLAPVASEPIVIGSDAPDGE